MIGNLLGENKVTPATGVAFGLEQITEELKRRSLPKKECVSDAYIIPIGKTRNTCIEILQELRESGINCDMDFQKRGISKNLEYANRYGIPFVLFVGDEELSQNKVKLKDMISGNEFFVLIEIAIKMIKGEKNE